MPVAAYFKGHGESVMANRIAKHGAKAGKSEFYATANKRPAMKPPKGAGMAGVLAKHKRAGAFKKKKAVAK